MVPYADSDQASGWVSLWLAAWLKIACWIYLVLWQVNFYENVLLLLHLALGDKGFSASREMKLQVLKCDFGWRTESPVCGKRTPLSPRGVDRVVCGPFPKGKRCGAALPRVCRSLHLSSLLVRTGRFVMHQEHNVHYPSWSGSPHCIGDVPFSGQSAHSQEQEFYFPVCISFWEEIVFSLRLLLY